MPTLCAVVGCGTNSIRNKGELSLFRIPKIISHQGEQTKRLSTERRSAWLKNIYRKPEDLTDKKTLNTRVCSKHFVSGKFEVRNDSALSILEIAIYVAISRVIVKTHVIFVGKASDLYDVHNIDWAPTLNMGHENIKTTDSSRGERATKRAKKPRYVPKKKTKTTATTTSI